MSIKARNTPEDYYEYIFNWPATILFVILDLAIIVMILIYGVNLTLIILSFLVAFVYMNLFSLQIVIAQGDLSLSYGIGLFRSFIARGDISQCMVDHNKSLYAWFFNPQGESVAVIYFRDGARKLIPSNEPRVVIDRLRSR